MDPWPLPSPSRSAQSGMSDFAAISEKKNCWLVSAEVVLLAVVDKRELAHSVGKIKQVLFIDSGEL